MYPKDLLPRTLATISLVLLLVSCGSSTRLASNMASATPSISTDTGAYPGKEITFSVGNLLIRSVNGITCESHHALHFPSDGSNFVLATDRLKYDSAELQQMEAYAQTIYDGTYLTSSLPNTLAWVPGANTLKSLSPGEIGNPGCYGVLDLTNLGKDTIQIESMNIQLTSASQKNDRKGYRLINFCSLLPPSEAESCGSGGQKGGELFYLYYRLQPGQNGKVFSSYPPTVGTYNPATDQILSKTTLSSNDEIRLNVILNSSQSNITYHLVPDLILYTSDGLKTITLPQLATTLYFADESSPSCYRLRGSTFVIDDTNTFGCI